VENRRAQHGTSVTRQREQGRSEGLVRRIRRLRIRWEIRDDIHQAFISLGCAIICWRRLKTSLRSQS
jgi:hypothetical protein